MEQIDESFIPLCLDVVKEMEQRLDDLNVDGLLVGKEFTKELFVFAKLG